MDSIFSQLHAFSNPELQNEFLQNGDSFFHRIVSEVEDYAIIFIDPDGTIMSWNKGAEKIKGYSPAEILGKNYKIFYLPEDRQDKLPERLLEGAITTGKA